MTVYYNPGRALTISFFAWHHTSFKMVAMSWEYWFYNLVHVLCCGFFMFAGTPAGEVHMVAVAALQFFLMFMLIYFNEHCYRRYLKFYPQSMEAMHHCACFAMETIVSMPAVDLQKYRLGSSRFLLAALFLHFTDVTGGMKDRAEWREICSRGLLTEEEASSLKEYPGGRLTYILCTQALHIIRMALLQEDFFWQPHSQNISYVYERFSNHAIGVIRSCQQTSHLLTLPVPYSYCHIVNFVITFNLLLSAVALASFQHVATVPIYGISVLFFMGLHEVSVALVDPFGNDDVDFPIAHFLDYAIDQVFCLIQAFTNPTIIARIPKLISNVEPFSKTQLSHSMDRAVELERQHNEKRDNAFSWEKAAPMQKWTVEGKPKNMLLNLLVDHEDKIKQQKAEMLGKWAETAGTTHFSQDISFEVLKAAEGLLKQIREQKNEKEVLTKAVEALHKRRKELEDDMRERRLEQLRAADPLRKSAEPKKSVKKFFDSSDELEDAEDPPPRNAAQAAGAHAKALATHASAHAENARRAARKARPGGYREGGLLEPMTGEEIQGNDRRGKRDNATEAAGFGSFLQAQERFRGVLNRAHETPPDSLSGSERVEYAMSTAVSGRESLLISSTSSQHARSRQSHPHYHGEDDAPPPPSGTYTGKSGDRSSHSRSDRRGRSGSVPGSTTRGAGTAASATSDGPAAAGVGMSRTRMGSFDEGAERDRGRRAHSLDGLSMRSGSSEHADGDEASLGSLEDFTISSHNSEGPSRITPQQMARADLRRQDEARRGAHEQVVRPSSGVPTGWNRPAPNVSRAPSSRG
eukprot:NODE_934_length_2690_cov_10.696059.p1 GENE.NODE_934_length_2690_cov_10.696059~~NODE_934_length_2690_cov_10.696059.p1  ORF type:complete len:807 (-),score=93.40 NODE_934_length_2690_cov_10.696059:138-2558(-)